MDEWHKALVLILRKLGIIEILITQSDTASIQAIENEDDRPCAVCFGQPDGIHIRLTTRAEEKRWQNLQQQSEKQQDCDGDDNTSSHI